MKRIKFLVLASVVATAMMGAGYAAWTDTTVLSSTVRTGNFDMQITKATTRTGDNQAQNEVHNWHSYDWTHAEPVSFDANTAVVTFNDLYPGGMVQVDMTTKNMGTLPARLKSAKVEYVSGDRAVFNKLLAQTSWKADINGDGTQDDWAHVENWTQWRPVGDALDKLVENTDLKNLVIEPKGYFSLGDGTEEGCIKFKLDPSVGNEFQNKTVKFKITFNWEQWTTDPNAKPYDGVGGYGGDGDL